ncbi:MAG: hypothetical protein IJW92_07280 [Clostridia bacterium]|nr:hypothetical protein [Clostridia bacterium]
MKQWWQRFKYKLAGWMQGRYGNDELTYALFITALVLIVLSYIPFLFPLSFIALLLLVWSSYRGFSKNIPKRRRELERYQKIIGKPKSFLKLQKNKWRDRKTHCYFKCTNCRAVLRVPKGKGEIIVTCPKCANRIEKKT